MLFSYVETPLITAENIKAQLDQLKAFELAHFAEYDISALISNRTFFYDNLLIHLWRHFQLDQQPELSLIAVGGYGRQEMFPLSDLDMLLLSAHALDEATEQRIVQFVQFLWDCGFEVGHSVRTLTECEQEGKNEITIATNLLEARFLAGNLALFTQLEQCLNQPDFWPMTRFFAAKVKEKNDRYQRYHNTSYNLEPDLKYNPGGLRDLHLLYWIALRHTGAKTLKEIFNTGFLYQEEFERLTESQHFLFKIRFALHLILKRYDNRLLFDRQIKVSEMLGFSQEGNRGVEKMMKQFFQALRTISRLSDIIVKYYQENFLAETYDLFIHQLDEDFELRNQMLCLRTEKVLLNNPARILDLFFYLTQFPQAELQAATLRQLQQALEQLNGYLCDLPQAREKFVSLLNQPNAIQRALIPMHQYAVLTAYLPQWKKIEGLMQFDLFHIYTVDEHSLRVMAKLESFADPQNQSLHPICHQIFKDISDRSLLYITALFHDIAKGRGGDHAELGAVDILEFAELHGFDCREVGTMSWLVQQHLLMSTTAQRRDIYDPEVIMDFAEEVKNKVRLDLLTCLTIADICATNETLWNSWKRALFATLYNSTKQQFSQGMDLFLDNNQKIQQHRQQALALLCEQTPDLSAEQIEGFWLRCPEDYFLRNSPEQIAWHTTLLIHFTGNILVKISNRFSSGGTEVFVYCQDKPNIFNQVVSTICAKRFSIHDAQILTGEDGYVFDSFIITELNGETIKAERRRDLEAAMSKILQSEQIPTLPPFYNRRLQHFTVKTEVRFLKENKTAHTELEITALDKTGLLAQISQIFTEQKLNLLNAKITTIGEKAEDFFILTNEQGFALNKAQRTALESALLARIC